MCNVTDSRKDMSDLWIIVCVLCCFSLTESQTVSIQQNTTDWFTAFQTCKKLSGRLPDVNIFKNQLELQDLGVTKNISSPFWIGATYDLLDINVAEPHYGYNYPNTCCEKIQNVGGYHQVQCSDCLHYYEVICVTSTNEIPTDGIISENLNWHSAFLKCKNMRLTLPTRNNQQFLAKVTPDVGAFWLDGIRQINFMPDIGIQNRSCLYSLFGSIHEGNCYNTSMTTVCVFGAKYTIDTSKTTESMQFQTTTNGTFSTSPNIHAAFTSLTNMAAEERVIDPRCVNCCIPGKTRTDNKFLFWGIVTALSVLLAVSTITIIILVIKLRQARRQMADSWKKEATSTQKLADIDSYQTLDHRNRDSRNGYDTLTHITTTNDERI